MASSQISFFMKIIGIPLAHNLIRFYLSLVRIRIVNEDSLLTHLKKGGKAIAAIWHQRFFGAIGYGKKLGSFFNSPALHPDAHPLGRSDLCPGEYRFGRIRGHPPGYREQNDSRPCAG